MRCRRSGDERSVKVMAHQMTQAMKVKYFSPYEDGETTHMANGIRFELAVPAEVRKDGDHFVSFCPPLDVYSQGPSEEAALDNLVEALQLFVESCLARGTLDRVLKDCGFEPDANPGVLGRSAHDSRPALASGA